MVKVTDHTLRLERVQVKISAEFARHSKVPHNRPRKRHKSQESLRRVVRAAVLLCYQPVRVLPSASSQSRPCRRAGPARWRVFRTWTNALIFTPPVVRRY